MQQFLDLVEQYGLVLSLTKYRLFQSQIDFLGVIISDGKITSQEHIPKKILEFQTPFTSLVQLQQFLGTLNWINWQIPNLANKAKQLTDLLKKDQTKWTTSHSIFVADIKEIIRHLPILDILDPKLPIIIYTDASQFAWAGVLCNLQDTQVKVCRFASGKFQDAQKNYPSTHKEVLYKEAYCDKCDQLPF